MIKRILRDKLQSQLGSSKAIIVMGARQVGKSTLLKELLDGNTDVMWMNGDELDIQQLFSQLTSTRIRTILGNHHILVIDEAQRIPDIGLRMKLVTDQVEGVQIIATGSSSFELANKVNEPLTGRKREFRMFPVSFSEMVSHSNLLDEVRLIPHRMVYGYYPEVVCSPGNERVVLRELSDSYLYRDILSYDGIGKPEKMTS